jgi:hypothetical protein
MSQEAHVECFWKLQEKSIHLFVATPANAQKTDASKTRSDAEWRIFGPCLCRMLIVRASLDFIAAAC